MGKHKQGNKQQQEQAAAYRAFIQQARSMWLGKQVKFTIPQGVGYGVVASISEFGDVVVVHYDSDATGLPPAFAFNLERISTFLELVG
ncbi:MAG: hypothetical protein ACYDER_18810 [Ktedonobacteraceae bacterium]